MRALGLALLLLAAPALDNSAGAQPRSFSCVGAEALEDDVFAVPFTRGSTTLRDTGRSAIAAAAQLAEGDRERNICVFGHADRSAGAGTSTQIAAQRARAVAQALSQQGIERDRIRAEARVGAFSGRQHEPESRAVTIVVLPTLP